MRIGMLLKRQVKVINFLAMSLFIILTATFLMMISCNEARQIQKEEPMLTILNKVDDLNQVVEESVANYDWDISIDHHRMAKEEGVYTPPAIATIFSDSNMNSKIISNQNQLVGLDLPFKVLCYSNPDTTQAKVAYTSAEFIAKRHGISMDLLEDYQQRMNTFLTVFDVSLVSETNCDSVFKGFGVVKIQSDFDFETTIEQLKKIVHAQSDTRWFGEIDYQAETKGLNPTTLLLFGGPGPGAKAMVITPKIGLDAFCQKLLVYKNNNDEVWVAFNDIEAFSNLYYGMVTKPQQMINQRLIVTFTKAIHEMED